MLRCSKPELRKVLALSCALVTAALSSAIALRAVRTRRIISQPQGYGIAESCAFFLGEKKFDTSGGMHLVHAHRASAQGGCIPRQTRCQRNCRKSRMLTHTWINIFDFSDALARPKLELMLRAWMITQDLRRSRFRLWISVFRNGDSLPDWLQAFSPYVSVRLFDYDAESASTPLALSRHFSSWRVLNESMHNDLPTLSDIVRQLIIYNYGGLWLDTDAVPLRDLWPITRGVGLSFMPKFKGYHANNHAFYVPCPRSSLSKRRLEAITMFPWNYPDSWPRDPLSTNRWWVYNDGLSEQVRATQALEYNISHSAEVINPTSFPDRAWFDVEFAYPLAWFDPWWMWWGRNANSSEFRRYAICEGAYLWHRLTKHVRYRSGQEGFGSASGCDELWDEIYDTQWVTEPIELSGGVVCR